MAGPATNVPAYGGAAAVQPLLTSPSRAAPSPALAAFAVHAELIRDLGRAAFMKVRIVAYVLISIAACAHVSANCAARRQAPPACVHTEMCHTAPDRPDAAVQNAVNDDLGVASVAAWNSARYCLAPVKCGEEFVALAQAVPLFLPWDGIAEKSQPDLKLFAFEVQCEAVRTEAKPKGDADGPRPPKAARMGSKTVTLEGSSAASKMSFILNFSAAPVVLELHARCVSTPPA